MGQTRDLLKTLKCSELYTFMFVEWLGNLVSKWSSTLSVCACRMVVVRKCNKYGSGVQIGLLGKFMWKLCVTGVESSTKCSVLVRYLEHIRTCLHTPKIGINKY